MAWEMVAVVVGGSVLIVVWNYKITLEFQLLIRINEFFVIF
jgi:hypothetical protein